MLSYSGFGEHESMSIDHAEFATLEWAGGFNKKQQNKTQRKTRNDDE
jgi:hypothetical protein